MKQVKCPDCGAEYPSYLKDCPSCGCPNDNWEEVTEEQSPKEETSAQATTSEEESKQERAESKNTAKTTPSDKTDWANYVYECGLLFWHCISRRYFKTSGRASRREFWSFLIILNVILGGPVIYTQVVSSNQAFLSSSPGPMFTPAEAIIFIVCLIPLITVWARRMHDIGKSGWWCLVPYADLFLALKKSDEGENEYGEPAKDDI